MTGKMIAPLIQEIAILNAVFVMVPWLKNVRNAYQMPTSIFKRALVNVLGHGVECIVICGWVNVMKYVVHAAVQLSWIV